MISVFPFSSAQPICADDASDSDANDATDSLDRPPALEVEERTPAPNPCNIICKISDELRALEPCNPAKTKSLQAELAKTQIRVEQFKAERLTLLDNLKVVINGGIAKGRMNHTDFRGVIQLQVEAAQAALTIEANKSFSASLKTFLSTPTCYAD